MYTDMTALTIQSTKIVSNEVKDNWALLEPSYGKKTQNVFGQPNCRVESWRSRSKCSPGKCSNSLSGRERGEWKADVWIIRTGPGSRIQEGRREASAANHRPLFQCWLLMLCRRTRGMVFLIPLPGSEFRSMSFRIVIKMRSFPWSI